MLLLGNLGQQLDIQDTQRALRDLAAEAERAARAGDRAAHSVGALARENAELKLYLAAVTRLLVAKGVISPRELADIVDAVDRSDGQADGGYSGRITPPG
ncbi:hypothetical protein [Oleiharenicola sp. Vm1]|uniref:hypothetical protein n=1 Tax=Oleiharenicola sp. Vm1 TaxID=3398393 RepID=UPI0039F4CFF7